MTHDARVHVSYLACVARAHHNLWWLLTAVVFDSTSHLVSLTAVIFTLSPAQLDTNRPYWQKCKPLRRATSAPYSILS